MPVTRRGAASLLEQTVQRSDDVMIGVPKGTSVAPESVRREARGGTRHIPPEEAAKELDALKRAQRSTAAPIEDAVPGARAPQDWAGYTEPGNWFTGALDRGGIGGMLAMGTIGGTASLATGGEFLQGAGVGIGFGYAARGIHRNMTTQLGGKGSAMFGESGKLAQRAASEEGGFGGMMAGAALKMGPSVQTIQARHAMMAGAGLFGAMGGGNRKNNHRRGFNAHRGNTF